jgi:hypothetical protein
MTARPPPVPRNATGERLLEAYLDALAALTTARDKLARTAPNERDYYLSTDPKAFMLANDTYHARLSSLDVIMREIQEIVDSISNQLGR